MVTQLPALSVVHLLAPAEVGGLERVVEGLAAGQRRAGHRVSVIAISHVPEPPHAFIETLTARGVEVHVLSVSSRDYLRERRLVLERCRELRPDVVHVHGLRCDILHSDVARRVDARGVATAHGRTSESLKMRLYERAQELGYRRYDAVAVVSASLARSLERRGVPRRLLHVVPNAWVGEGITPLSRADARRALGLQDGGSHWLGWVGRLSPEKGPDIFLDALERLRDESIEAIMVGDGPARAALEKRAKSARVRFAGVVQGAGRLCAAFDAFVLSSRSEGTPIALFEAMAAGVPVVATRVGGIPDVISDREALLVPSEDPDAIASAVRRLFADQDGAARRTLAARRRLESVYATGPWLTRYDRLYRGIEVGI